MSYQDQPMPWWITYGLAASILSVLAAMALIFFGPGSSRANCGRELRGALRKPAALQRSGAESSSPGGSRTLTPGDFPLHIRRTTYTALGVAVSLPFLPCLADERPEAIASRT